MVLAVSSRVIWNGRVPFLCVDLSYKVPRDSPCFPWNFVFNKTNPIWNVMISNELHKNIRNLVSYIVFPFWNLFKDELLKMRLQAYATYMKTHSNDNTIAKISPPLSSQWRKSQFNVLKWTLSFNIVIFHLTL